MRNLPSARGPAALFLSLFSLAAFAGDFRLAFIDVGQGDAAVVISPSGCAAVFDGGPTGSGADIKAYLRSQGVTHVEMVFLSHYHLDHLGGIDEIDVGTDAVTVGTVYDRGGTYSSQAFAAYAEHFAGKRQTVTRGQTFSLCSEVTFKVEAVNANGISTSDENARSVAVKVSFGSFDALIGGDLPSSPNVEGTLVGQTGEVEVYKVHHHGSASSSSAALLNELLPTVSVISLGINNNYGHPTPEALSRLKAVGSAIYMTEDPATQRILGNVLVSSPSGAGYIVAQGGTSQSYASKGGAPVDLTPPSAPTNLVASASGDSADLGWNASSDNVGVTGYRVYRSSNGSSFSLAGTTPVTGFSEAGLTAGATYWYRVTAFDAAGNESTVSNTAQVSIASNGDTQAPTAPSSLSASATGSSTIEVSWSGATDNVGVTGYSLYRSTDGSNWSLHTSTTGSGYTDSGLSAGATYWYRVRAEDGAGNVSADSAVASATTVAVTGPGRVIVNEVLVNEPGSATGGEFIELVNVGGTAVDIGGWKLSDGSEVRHTFASGTLVAPGKAVVVFASASYIPAGTPNAVAASTGQLNLNNTGDTVTLAQGKKRQDRVSITSALASNDGVSANRTPDATADVGFVLHTSLSGLSASPGLQASGAAY